MLTISPCFDKPEVAEYCKRCKQPYHAGFYLYVAENRGERLATALFEISGDRAQVMLYDAMDPADHFLFDGVLRSGLNYAAEQGIENGHIPEAFRYHHREMFGKLNYPAAPVFNITNFFQKYKNCRGV